MAAVAFEILLDDSLSNVTEVSALKAAANKALLSLINDFEDGNWRYPKFRNFLWDNIAETALSAKERASLVNQNHSSLVAAAKNLRLTDKDKIGSGSEIAEVFLYGVMKDHFNAQPVVPKIFYKQNAQDNAKGADSVHIVVEGDDFTLWFGEAKFYNSIEDTRLDEVVQSVYNALASDKLKKENTIITSISDIDNLNIPTDVIARIKSALEPKESLDSIKSRIRIPILLLHECEITSKQGVLTKEYKDEILNFHKARAEAYFSKQIKKASSVHMYGDIKFHIILFPVPNKSQIVKEFVESVAYYKGQG